MGVQIYPNGQITMGQYKDGHPEGAFVHKYTDGSQKRKSMVTKMEDGMYTIQI